MKKELKLKFPNAYRGVKKLFLAELIGVIAALLLITSGILQTAGVKNVELVTKSVAVALTSTIATIVLFLLQIIGLSQAGKDDKKIRFAMFLAILNILIAIGTAVILAFKIPNMGSITGILEIVSGVAEILIVYFVFNGIADLAKKLGNASMEKKGRNIAGVLVLLYLFSIAFSASSKFISGTAEWIQTVVAVLAIIAALVELAMYVVKFFYLAKATKMLKK